MLTRRLPHDSRWYALAPINDHVTRLRAVLLHYLPPHPDLDEKGRRVWRDRLKYSRDHSCDSLYQLTWGRVTSVTAGQLTRNGKGRVHAERRVWEQDQYRSRARDPTIDTTIDWTSRSRISCCGTRRLLSHHLLHC